MVGKKPASGLSPERITRLCARRPWVTIGLWVVLVVISLFLRATLFSDAVTTEFDFTNVPESKRADNLLEEKLDRPKGTKEVVIVQSDTLTVNDPEFATFAEGLFAKIAALGPEVIREGTLTSYYLSDASFLVSRDLRTTIIPFTMAGDFNDSTDNIERVIEVVEEAKGQSDFKVLMTGQATVGTDFEEVATDGLLKGEIFGAPIALIILILVFGALVAALIPIVLAAVSIVVAMGAACVDVQRKCPPNGSAKMSV